MTWARFHDGTPRDPKFIGLSDSAHRLWFSSVCYCCEHLTDGELPLSALVFCYQARPKKLAILAAELVKSGLWTVKNDDVFLVVNFLKYNPSRVNVEAERNRRHKAGEAGARAKWHGGNIDKDTSGAPPGREKGGAPAEKGRGKGDAPVPVPSRPVPDPPLAAAAAREEALNQRAVRAWERQSPGGINRGIMDILSAWIAEGVPIEYIEAACEAAREAGCYKPPNFVDSIIRRYQRQGNTEDQRGKTTGGGASQGGRSVRESNGRHLGASQRVPGAGVDWEEQARAQERRLAGAEGGDQRLPEDEVG